MALRLQLRTKIKSRTLTNPSLCHLFSTTKSDDYEPEASSSSETTAKDQSSFYGYVNFVKASLKSPSSTPTRPKTLTSSDFISPPPRLSKISSLDEIQKNLSEFRKSSALSHTDPISSTPSSPSQLHVSLQEIYRRNVMPKSGETKGAADKPRGVLSFDAIRERLRQNRGAWSDRKPGDSLSSFAFRDSLKLKPPDSAGSGTSSTVIGGTGTLPALVFGKEMREKDGQRSSAMNNEFVKMYGYEELGEKLNALRPEAKGEGWFSLAELNERLMKLREIEEKGAESSITGVAFKDLRETLKLLKISDDERAKKTSLQRLDILGQFGTTPYMQKPPKEHLVEKYFHLDNMSSEEKMKIELAKVRDEFKMSESDCGSARVQVAQLTTKIKHLSSVLHKKDKHSRKGLKAMVERRKRILKYLRRTDWASYCFVISKLGLRDNPELKY